LINKFFEFRNCDAFGMIMSSELEKLKLSELKILIGPKIEKSFL